MNASSLESIRARARRAYELGRLRRASALAALITIAIGALSFFVVGSASLWLLPVTLVVWAALGFRGGVSWEGARRGAIAGALILAIPSWFLHAGAAACPAPVLCAALGAAIGGVAVVSLRRPTVGLVERALGVGVAACSVAVLRCPAAPRHEGLWLVVGLVTGLVVATAALSLAPSAVVTRSARSV